MTTIRVVKRDRFTIVDNDTIRDDRLSFRARGVLIWLLSQPDEWTCDGAVIAEHGQEGRDAILTALRELQGAGYLVRRKEQDTETGRWSSWSDIHERPSTGVGSPGFGKSGLKRKNKKKDPLSPPEKSETELFATTPPTPKGERDDPSFIAFAERYPSRAKRNVKVSARRWAKLSKADRALASAVLQPWLNYWKAERTDGQYIPAMEVWIGTSGNRGKGRGWETEPPRKARRPQTDLESQRRMSGQII